MKSVSIRVSAPDYSDDYVDNTVVFMSEFLQKFNYDEGCFMVFEYKGIDEETGFFINPHYHAVIQGVKMDDAFSKRFKRFMISKDNRYSNLGQQGGKRSLYVQDAGELEKCYAYLCKGASVEDWPLVMYNDVEGLTDEKVWEYHEQYWDKFKNKEKVTEEKVKKASVNADAVFLDWFKSKRLESYKRIDLLTNKLSYAFMCEELIEDVLTFYNAHQKGFKKQLLEHKLHLIYNSVIREFHPQMFQDYRKELTRQIQFSNSCFV